MLLFLHSKWGRRASTTSWRVDCVIRKCVTHRPSSQHVITKLSHRSWLLSYDQNSLGHDSDRKYHLVLECHWKAEWSLCHPVRFQTSNDSSTLSSCKKETSLLRLSWTCLSHIIHCSDKIIDIRGRISIANFDPLPSIIVLNAGNSRVPLTIRAWQY